jgi:CheY-like chemotaxis protein
MRRRTRLEAQQECVLVVAEAARLAKGLVDVIEQAGHAVIHADTAREAFALALAWQPRVVCVDLRLAGMGADEVALRMVAAFGAKRPSLVAIASPGATLDQDRARQMGFDLVLDASALAGLGRLLTTAGNGPSLATASRPSERRVDCRRRSAAAGTRRDPSSRRRRSRPHQVAMLLQHLAAGRESIFTL